MESKNYGSRDLCGSSVFGVYFKSPNDISTEYVISLNQSCTIGEAPEVIIWLSSCPFSYHYKQEELYNGSEVMLDEDDIDDAIVRIKFNGRYFYPTFNYNRELEYDKQKAYGSEEKTDKIASLMEAINFAIEYGLKETGIKHY